jgi:KDO2-lipid IV(A) lauroyltransferase
MTISHGLEYAAFWILTRLVQSLPARAADRLAVALGDLAHTVLTSRRRIALGNLKRAFKDGKSDAELAAITKKVFRNMARATIEFARLPVLSHQKILDMVPEYSGVESIEKGQREGRGIMFISGHFGSWELLGAWLFARGFPADFLVGQQHNPYVDRMFNHFRRSSGVSTIPVGVAARHVLKSLKSGRIVCLLSDQHSATGGTVVRFFDRPAATPKGPAAFAVKVGCPIILGLLVREKDNRHRAVLSPPIYPPGTGDTEKDITEMTQAYTSRLEEMIRRYPEQWMWTHRRWKLD